MKYQLCPKCNGQGYVSKPPWVAGDQNEWTSTSAFYPCDICSGAKVLLVPDNNYYLGLAESSLKKDWDTKEEDEAWKDL